MDIAIWEKESFYAPVDVLIVGAGLLGLWTARELKIKSPGLKVTLIDKAVIPCGASTRNAGFACFGSPSEMLNDQKVMGSDAMWGIVEMRYNGIQKIKSVFSNIRSGFENCGGFEVFSHNKREEWEAFEEEFVLLNDGMKTITGVDDVFAAAPGKLAGYGLKAFSHMVENRLEGGLHSGMLMQALLETVRSMGVNVLTGVEFTEYVRRGTKLFVQTRQDISFVCSQVLLTTNAYLSKQVPALGIRPARGQIILSPPIPGLSLRGTFHFDEGFYYFRNLGNRILLGGARNEAFESEETLYLETTPFILDRLYAFIQQHIPAAAIFPAETFESWSGIMAMHPRKQPVLAEVEPGVIAAMCCNGMGVALSPIFSEVIAQTLLE